MRYRFPGSGEWAEAPSDMTEAEDVARLAMRLAFGGRLWGGRIANEGGGYWSARCKTSGIWQHVSVRVADGN